MSVSLVDGKGPQYHGCDALPHPPRSPSSCPKKKHTQAYIVGRHHHVEGGRLLGAEPPPLPQRHDVAQHREPVGARLEPVGPTPRRFLRLGYDESRPTRQACLRMSRPPSDIVRDRSKAGKKEKSKSIKGHAFSSEREGDRTRRGGQTSIFSFRSGGFSLPRSGYSEACLSSCHYSSTRDAFPFFFELAFTAGFDSMTMLFPPSLPHLSAFFPAASSSSGVANP